MKTKKGRKSEKATSRVGDSRDLSGTTSREAEFIAVKPQDDLEYYRFSDPDVGTFAIDTLRPYAWLEQGEGLLEAAGVLVPELERRWSDRSATTGEQRSNLDQRQIHRVFLMLCGFAVENFCKALIAVRLPQKTRERVRTGAGLPDAFITHDLHKLLRKAGFAVPPEDDGLVKRLEMAALWWGRYPVPLAPSQLRPKTALGKELWAHTLGSDEVQRAIEFVKRVSSFVRDSLP